MDILHPYQLRDLNARPEAQQYDLQVDEGDDMDYEPGNDPDEMMLDQLDEEFERLEEMEPITEEEIRGLFDDEMEAEPQEAGSNGSDVEDDLPEGAQLPSGGQEGSSNAGQQEDDTPASNGNRDAPGEGHHDEAPDGDTPNDGDPPPPDPEEEPSLWHFMDEMDVECLLCDEAIALPTTSGIFEVPHEFKCCEKVVGDLCAFKQYRHSPKCPYCRHNVISDVEHNYAKSLTVADLRSVRRRRQIFLLQFFARELHTDAVDLQKRVREAAVCEAEQNGDVDAIDNLAWDDTMISPVRVPAWFENEFYTLLRELHALQNAPTVHEKVKDWTKRVEDIVTPYRDIVIPVVKLTDRLEIVRLQRERLASSALGPERSRLTFDDYCGSVFSTYHHLAKDNPFANPDVTVCVAKDADKYPNHIERAADFTEGITVEDEILSKKIQDFINDGFPSLHSLASVDDLPSAGKKTKLYYGVLLLWRVKLEVTNKLYLNYDIAEEMFKKVDSDLQKLSAYWRQLVKKQGREFFQKEIQWFPDLDRHQYV